MKKGRQAEILLASSVIDLRDSPVLAGLPLRCWRKKMASFPEKLLAIRSFCLRDSPGQWPVCPFGDVIANKIVFGVQ